MLRSRMVVALAVSAALTTGMVALVVHLSITVNWLIGLLLMGFVLEGADALGKRPKRIDPPQEVRQRVEPALQRLCALADMPLPRVRYVNEGRPLCWTTSLPSRRPTIQISMGMIETCRDPELEAVLAHELAHIAHGDAWVMTLMSGPLWVMAGVRHYWEQRKRENWLGYVLGTAAMGVPAAILALPGALAARHLSRHRELAADRTAALFTGSPAAVAAALMLVSDTLANIPAKDLRAATALTVLNWLPLESGRGVIARLWATHPPLELRLEQLQQLERKQA